MRDRDSIDSPSFKQRIRNLGIEEVVIAPWSPWQHPSVERVIGSIRRELLEQVIVLNERPLMRLLHAYVDYDHGDRTHRALAMDAPIPRPVPPPELGGVREIPEVGGLHHHDARIAA